MIPAPKIIFSDIDGTFLLDDHTVSEKSAEAVRALLASGIPFVLVSARMPEAIYPITQSIGVTIPIISYSGALALTAEGETLEDVRVDAGAAGMVLSAIEDRYPELTVNYYAGRRWYVRDEDDPRVRHEEDITHAKSERGNFDMLLSINTLPSKILLMGEPRARRLRARRERPRGRLPHAPRRPLRAEPRRNHGGQRLERKRHPRHARPLQSHGRRRPLIRRQLQRP